MTFQRLSILGVGLLGGSIGLAVRSLATHCKIVGYGHRRATLDAAIKLGAIDEGYDDVRLAVRGADLIILCTPVGLFEKTLADIAGSLTDGAVVTDVGSTKQSVVAAARCLPAGVHFVGSHPMAGSEKRGVEHARADLFQNATCIITPDDQTNIDALKRLEEFWRLLGMKIARCSPAEHDRLLGDVSHLPHAVATAIIAMQSDAALPLAGKGFLDATRIAGGDGGLWRDIFHDNRENVRASVERLKQELDRFLELLAPEKAEDLRHWLDQNAARREAMLEQKRD